MAVEQMKYVSILGPLPKFESFVLKHIINSNVQLEPSFRSLNIRGLIPFEDCSECEMLHKRLRVLNDRMKARIRQYDKRVIVSEILDDFDMEKACAFVQSIEERIESHKKMGRRDFQPSDRKVTRCCFR